DIRNFNISVTVTDEFMEALDKKPSQKWMCSFKGKAYKPRRVLRHPNGAVHGSEEIDITVKDLFDEIVEGAWVNGEPGIAFVDTWNKSNPLPDLGPLASTNPCGEQTLHPYDNCNLGSINLAAFVGKDKKVKWERLREATRGAVRLMDNVIDRFDFPVPQVTELAKRNRRIGLGVMGFADMLYQMGVGYNTKEGFQAAEKVMRFVDTEAYKMSQLLAKEKGEFPNYGKSIFGKKSAPHSLAQEPGMGKKMRNAALTTVAPTGSISMMLDTSSGIEPNFALAYIKQDKDGHQYNYLNRHFEAALAKLSLSSKEKDEIMQEVVKTGSIQHLANLPKLLREIFVVAMDISGEDHMKMQASFQKYVDNSISKTINLPNSATKEEVIQSFISAWKLGCKSCTVYRDGSRTIQILNVGDAENIVSTTEAPSAAKKGIDLKEDRNRIAPRKRPDMMAGKTYRMNTGYGKLYVTVNNDEKGVPFEVFATIGKSGGFFQEQSEAICRLISLSLRSGVKVEEVVKDLKGIRGPMPIFTERGTVLSLPDAIGRVLEDHMGVMREVEEVLQRPESQEVLPFVDTPPSAIANFGFMPGCPDCGAPLNMQEGCISCKMCGFSRCS
ncbi:MAG: adenosylcobalamin-dependent ribonucleoside-diphosphate reductase, partial [bacterium]|nr:adenosylcobalamin-dependent ribonucleoside-diphosphate reductase [bacterium]